MIEAEFLQYTQTFSILEIASLIFLIAVISETTWDCILGKRKLFKDSAANFIIAVVTSILERTLYGSIFVIGLVLTSNLSIIQIQSSWWSWILAFILADLTYYWMHRAEHQIRILWANHSIHHSSEEFNFTTALRISWVDALIEWVFFVPMMLLGFSVVQTIIVFLIIISYQSWVHTEKIGKLGAIDKILNTPSAHRVHHGQNRQYINKNYGGVFMIWDQIFGTYEPEGEKVIYGITIPIRSFNPLIINFNEYYLIWKDIKNAKNISEFFSYIFKGPGWKPKR